MKPDSGVKGKICENFDIISASLRNGEKGCDYLSALIRVPIQIHPVLIHLQDI